MSSVNAPYSQVSAQSVASSGFNAGLFRDDSSSRLWRWILLALGAHLFLVLSIYVIILIAQFLGWDIKLLSMNVKPRDVEFVLVDDSPKAPPRKPTRNRAEHASRSGGEKKANQPTQMPQRAAGQASRKSPSRPSTQPHAAAHPAPPQPQRPAPRPQPSPRPMPRVARPSTPQPALRPQPPQPVAQQVPTPRPTPPAPPMPRAVRTANATPSPTPHPIAPTIRTPAPRNPSAAPVGPIVKTPGGSFSPSGGSSGGGNPGPSMIAANPSYGGGGRPGRAGGSGGHGSYNQTGSPGGGGGRAGIDAEEEPDFGPYIAELQRRIKRNWSPPTEDRNKRVVIIFHISRDGRLVGMQMKGTSGSPSADQAAMAAVRLSAPFKPLPPGYRGNDIPVEFTFDYQVFTGAKMR